MEPNRTDFVVPGIVFGAGVLLSAAMRSDGPGQFAINLATLSVIAVPMFLLFRHLHKKREAAGRDDWA